MHHARHLVDLGGRFRIHQGTLGGLDLVAQDGAARVCGVVAPPL